MASWPTKNSTLFRLLESKVPKSTPDIIDACIIDGNFLLHALPPHLPSIYRGLAPALSQKRIDIVFDAYSHPSILESDRARRGLEEKEYIITGPEQHRPSNLADSLKSRSLKGQLPQFLAVEWESPHPPPPPPPPVCACHRKSGCVHCLSWGMIPFPCKGRESIEGRY